MEINKDMIVFNVLEKHPQLLETFIKKGFVQMRDPVMRRTMAKTVTIEQACGIHGIDVGVFVNELNKTLKEAK